jgi:hypothetical protein
VRNDGQKSRRLKGILLMLRLRTPIFLTHINYQSDHEYLDDFITYSIPISDFHIIILMSLFHLLREFLEIKVHVEGHLDIGGIDIHHHILEHQGLLEEVLVLGLPML